jgi:hypothetical protein
MLPRLVIHLVGVDVSTAIAAAVDGPCTSRELYVLGVTFVSYEERFYGGLLVAFFYHMVVVHYERLASASGIFGGSFSQSRIASQGAPHFVEGRVVLLRRHLLDLLRSKADLEGGSGGTRRLSVSSGLFFAHFRPRVVPDLRVDLLLGVLRPCICQPTVNSIGAVVPLKLRSQQHRSHRALRRLWGNPLGRRSLFKPRRHLLGGFGKDEREHTSIGGDEHIASHSPVLRRIKIGGGACAIRLDAIRAGEYLVAKNIPIEVTCKDSLRFTVAIKLFIPCSGERLLVLPEDANPIVGKQIRSVQRGLRALRPGVVLVIGKPSPDGQYSNDAYDSQHHQ